MASNIFRLNWKDIGSAVLSAVIMAVLTYLTTLSSVVQADWKAVVSVAVMTGLTSLVKTLGTDSEGKFGGVLPVK